MKIISEREYIESVEYVLSFRVLNGRGMGYSFECDSNGKIHSLEGRPAAQKNFEAAINGATPEGVPVSKGEVIERKSGYWEPAKGRCECGSVVYLERFTNPCECGRDYNSSGQLLAPREQWGEETGEHWSECI
jgi:hypothetical protein